MNGHNSNAAAQNNYKEGYQNGVDDVISSLLDSIPFLPCEEKAIANKLAKILTDRFPADSE